MTGLKGSGLAIDIKDKKVYFGDGNRSISKVNFDGSGKDVILKNANVFKMAIDWIGRRIFWTKFPFQRYIFVVNMDGKKRKNFNNHPMVNAWKLLWIHWQGKSCSFGRHHMLYRCKS